ncbi:MAG: tRNA-specific adenosine deaminase [Deltaproteobacteria bacterium RIFOXYB12_FULL_58_9]|nr:MAG: tRNA-specific adenosine deaminase [Deltaproteobacteria bacterium RIFOXYB12_FULL_58_9]
MNDEGYMALALVEARAAAEKGEVPVGAIVVCGSVVVSRAHNLRESNHDPLAHAEILAIRSAAAHLERWRLFDCTLYVTLEPCPMCAGAVVNARLERLVFAAADPRAGAVGSIMDIPRNARLNHRAEIRSGVCADESAAMLKAFFAKRR